MAWGVDLGVFGTAGWDDECLLFACVIWDECVGVGVVVFCVDGATVGGGGEGVEGLCEPLCKATAGVVPLGDDLDGALLRDALGDAGCVRLGDACASLDGGGVVALAAGFAGTASVVEASSSASLSSSGGVCRAVSSGGETSICTS